MSPSQHSSTCICTSDNNWCTTDTQLHEVKYVWTITNFSFREAEESDLDSPTFSAVTNQRIKWYLKIKPNGDTDAKDTISFYVYLSSDTSFSNNNEKLFAKYSASVLDCQQKVVCTTCSIDRAKINKYSKSVNWGRSVFIKKNEDFKNNILIDDKLTIICTIVFSEVCGAVSNTFSSYRCCSDSRAPLYSNVSLCNLAENFGTLLENQDFADVVLAVKDEEFHAHKSILAARSSVFAAMFKHNLKENETNRVEIEDMSKEVVAEMLRYIYTGKCENSEELACGLLAAADKYDLGKLKIICAETLFKKLSVDNAVNILVSADSHGVTELKSKTIAFIVARFVEILNTTAWKNLLVLHPDLIDEVCRALTNRLTAPNVGI